jgi:hypothetical protein
MAFGDKDIQEKVTEICSSPRKEHFVLLGLSDTLAALVYSVLSEVGKLFESMPNFVHIFLTPRNLLDLTHLH